MNRSVFLTFVAILVLCSPARAQWKVVRQFNAPVACIQFLNDAGAPGIGYAGLENGEIWRTTNAGVTWIQCVTPTILPPETAGSIVQFAFENSVIGWCATKDRIFRTQTPVLMTTDGGDHWSPLTFRGQLSGIYYHQLSRKLYLSSWDSGAFLSQDDGATWYNIDTLGWNGAVFSSPNFGIITNVTGTHGGNVLVTTDGAKSWQRVFGLDESWQAEAIPNSNSYVVMSEYSGRFITSTDGGFNWKTIHTFPNDFPFGMTGCVRVDNCLNYYIQSVHNGFYKSLDQGQTWIPFDGPNGLLDSRFCIANGSIWASNDKGDLYSHALGSQILAVYDTIPFQLHSSQCSPVTARLHFSTDCSNATASFVSASIHGSQAVSIAGQQIPANLHSMDSLTLAYDPTISPAATDTLVLRILFNGSPRDTSILIQGIDNSSHVFSLSSPTTLLLQARTCDSLKYTIHCSDFQATPCGIEFDSLLRISSPQDPAISILSKQLPLSLKDVDSFRVVYDPQTSYNAHTQIILSLVVGGRYFDTTISVTAQGPRQEVLILSQKSVDLEAHTCEPVTTSLHLTHNSCIPSHDTLIVVSMEGNTAITCTPNDSVMLVLSSNDSLTLTFDPTHTDSGNANLHLTVSFDGVRHDTVVPITAKKYQVTPNKPHLRFDDGRRSLAIPLNKPFAISVYLPQTLHIPSELDSIDLKLAFDGNELDAISAAPFQGLTISSFDRGNGYTHLHFHAHSSDSLLADSAFARITFISYLSRTNYDKVGIDRVLFDTMSTLTDNCSYLLSSDSDSVTATFLNDCGDSTTRNYLNDNPILSAFSILPNPSHGSAIVVLNLANKMKARLYIQDILGRSRERMLDAELNAGENRVAIPESVGDGLHWIVFESLDPHQPFRASRALIRVQ